MTQFVRPWLFAQFTFPNQIRTFTKEPNKISLQMYTLICVSFQSIKVSKQVTWSLSLLESLPFRRKSHSGKSLRECVATYRK